MVCQAQRSVLTPVKVAIERPASIPADYGADVLSSTVRVPGDRTAPDILITSCDRCRGRLNKFQCLTSVCGAACTPVAWLQRTEDQSEICQRPLHLAAGGGCHPAAMSCLHYAVREPARSRNAHAATFEKVNRVNEGQALRAISTGYRAADIDNKPNRRCPIISRQQQ